MNPTPSLPPRWTAPVRFENSTLPNDDALYDSESDLSEVAIPIVEEASPGDIVDHQSATGGQETDASESSAENHDESEDADFDIDDAAPPAAANDRRSTSIRVSPSHKAEGCC